MMPACWPRPQVHALAEICLTMQIHSRRLFAKGHSKIAARSVRKRFTFVLGFCKKKRGWRKPPIVRVTAAGHSVKLPCALRVDQRP